jgi:hypothetical protein
MRSATPYGLRFGRYEGMVFGPLMAAAAPVFAAAAPYLGAASAGMSIIGAVGQSAAQRQAGEVAYQNALQRQQMANLQASQLEQNAGQAQAAAQRQAIEAKRKGSLLASRMRAVMGASGAGIDNNLLASLQGEGDYAADTALFNGDEKARAMKNQALLDRWSGNASVWSGENARAAASRAADATLVGGIAKGVMSFADRYGGDLPNQNNGLNAASASSTMATWRSLPVSTRAPGFDVGSDGSWIAVPT